MPGSQPLRRVAEDPGYINDGLINNDLAQATSYEWPIPGMPDIGI